MNIRIENWNGHMIRFVEKEPGEWWAVAADICKALELKQVTRAISGLPSSGVTNSKVGVETGTKKDGTSAIQEVEVNVIDEQNIYRLVFKSRKKEAEQFQDWVYAMLKTLRQLSGLEGFQIFRMLDIEHQKKAMDRIKQAYANPPKKSYIKANTIADKAISTKYGYPKMLKKEQMTPEMLVQRQPILDDTVDLMTAVERFGLDISVSQVIYDKHTH
jgi:prophage antirepressor-like protein